MTREEAIRELKADYCGNRIICELYPDQCNREDCEIWLAIKALETQPEIAKDTNVPNNDCISRQAAIDALREAENHAFNGYYKGLVKAHKIVANLPSVQPEVAKDINALINGFISRLAEINAIENTDCELPSYAWDELTDAIMSVLSAQPEIIYCKDCKHVGTDATCCLVCNREGMGLKPYHVYHDDFCSYAERKIDD